MKKKRILAWIGIILLAGMYLSNLVLALIGSDLATEMLKVCALCTVAIPIVLYGFLVVMGKTGPSDSRQDPDPGLDEKDKEEEDDH